MIVRRAARRSFLVGCALLAACGLSSRQRAAVETFSTATLEFTGVTSTELVRTRTDVLEMNALRVQLDDDTLDRERMDEHFTVDRVKRRLDALTALQRYATLLQTLVTSSQQAELSQAADSFVGSLRKVEGVDLSDAKAAAVSAAVQRVGGLLVEAMRARAVREVVLEADPAVLQVIALIERDFDRTAEHWSLGYAQVATALDGAAALAARRVHDAALVGEARVLAQRNRERFAAIAARVQEAAGAVRAAETDLRGVVESRRAETADIERLAAEVDDFVKIYAILRDR
jgi:hypothetical protein